MKKYIFPVVAGVLSSVITCVPKSSLTLGDIIGPFVCGFILSVIALRMINKNK